MDLCERSNSPGLRRHPWELARVTHIKALLQRYAPTAGRALDVGAGDGFVAAALLEGALQQVTCWDVNYSESDLAHAAEPRLLRVATQPADRFDVILLLDVIEHVTDDVGLLREVRERNAGNQTIAVVTVPTYQALFGPHDVALGHHRRYTEAGLRRALERSGWVVDQSGQFFLSLFLARVVQKALSELRRQTEPPSNLGDWGGGQVFSALVTALLRLDAGALRALRLRSGLPLPGLSAWAVARPAPMNQ